METLINQLEETTKEFKTDFLNRYKKAVINEFNRLNEKYEINTVFQQVQEETGVHNIYHTRKEYNKAQKIVDVLLDIHHKRIGARVQREVEMADKTFNQKLEKLAIRIEKKGMKDNLIITSSYINVNFNCTITDGKQTLRAYTIIAEGPVQRPHYRYLVK